VDAPVRLVVGLGNPGPRYARTRHNAGRLAVEELARRLGAGRPASRFGGRLADVRGPRGPVTLLLPETYMNLSGDSVGPCAGSLKLAPEQVLVVHDEIDLPFGEVRGKTGGGHGGHNGLRSLKRVLGSDYPRVRIGVGRPGPDWPGDQADWVLARFSEPEPEVEALVGLAADMIEVVLEGGMDEAIARFHARPPGARASSRRARREEPGDAEEPSGEGEGT
jgi:PTH1 family peptidyl-tRNA hydrolase